MSLEKICISLELAKKLKELDLKQDSLFYYWCCENKECKCGGEIELQDCKATNLTNYSAFTASELLKILPSDIVIDYKDDNEECIEIVSYRLFIQKIQNDFNIYYYEKNESLNEETDTSLENACAKMLIHLIENGLLNLYDIDKNISG